MTELRLRRQFGLIGITRGVRLSGAQLLIIPRRICFGCKAVVQLRFRRVCVYDIISASVLQRFICGSRYICRADDHVRVISALFRVCIGDRIPVPVLRRFRRGIGARGVRRLFRRRSVRLEDSRNIFPCNLTNYIRCAGRKRSIRRICRIRCAVRRVRMVCVGCIRSVADRHRWITARLQSVIARWLFARKPLRYLCFRGICVRDHVARAVLRRFRRAGRGRCVSRIRCIGGIRSVPDRHIRISAVDLRVTRKIDVVHIPDELVFARLRYPQVFRITVVARAARSGHEIDISAVAGVRQFFETVVYLVFFLRVLLRLLHVRLRFYRALRRRGSRARSVTGICTRIAFGRLCAALRRLCGCLCRLCGDARRFGLRCTRRRRRSALPCLSRGCCRRTRRTFRIRFRRFRRRLCVLGGRCRTRCRRGAALRVLRARRCFRCRTARRCRASRRRACRTCGIGFGSLCVPFGSLCRRLRGFCRGLCRLRLALCRFRSSLRRFGFPLCGLRRGLCSLCRALRRFRARFGGFSGGLCGFGFFYTLCRLRSAVRGSRGTPGRIFYGLLYILPHVF